MRGVLALAVTLSNTVPAFSAAQEADPVGASTQLLRQAATPQRDGSHLDLLFGLRQLRDPQLAPFFDRLVGSEHWPLQAQAVLGLAELEPEGARRIDPSLIARIAPEAQEAVIAATLDLDMLGEDQVPAILAADNLHPMARMFLLAELVMLGKSIDRADLQRLAEADDHHIAGLASCLLAQTGDAGPLGKFRVKLAALASDRRGPVTLWLLEAVRRYELTACADWVRSLLEQSEVEADLVDRGVLALLSLDAPRGVDLWRRHVDANSTYGRRVRYGLMLLSASEEVPTAAYEQLRAQGESEELLARIIEVGQAISSGDREQVAKPLIALLDLGHGKSAEWALGYLNDMPKDQASSVYAHLIDRLTHAGPQPGDSVALAVQATTRLFELDSSAVLGRLAAAPDDSPQQQALLLGLFEVHSPEVSEAAKSLRRIGAGRADSMTLLLLARHAETLDPADVRQLGTIAAGGGRVSPVLQVQAAWLYLKHAGQLEAALAAAFD